MAQVMVALRPGAPEPAPGEGVEITRGGNVRLLRAWHENASQALLAVQAAVDSYLANAGDQAALLGPVAVVPGQHWQPGPGVS
jgi:hypothetical protein